MDAVYRAELQGDRVRWKGEAPPSSTRGTEVLIIVLEHHPPLEGRGEQMGRLLEELAAIGGPLSQIEDPVEWQREQRRSSGSDHWALV